MSRMKLFALEDEMVLDGAEAAGGEAAAAAAVAEEVETEASSIEETAQSVTDGIDATQELGDVKDVMDQSVEAGTGMDPVAAEMARISVRNILAKIGAESYAGNLIVASESFGSTSSRLANTRYASEGVGSFIAKVWEKIKIFFSDMWNKIKDFVVGLFNKEKALTGAIDRTMKKLGDVELSNKPKKISAKGKLGGFVFNSRQTVLNKAGITAFITRHASVKNVLVASVTAAKTGLETLAGNFTEDSAEQLFGKLKDLKDVNDNQVGSVSGNTLTIPGDGPFYGGLSGEVSYTAGGKFKGELIRSLNILSMVDSTHFKAEEVELTGSVSDLKDLLTKTKGLIDGGSSLRKEGKILEKSIEDSLKTITKTISASSKDTDTDAEKASKEGLNEFLKLIRKAVSNNTRVFTLASSLNFKLASAVLYYTEVCMFENSDRYVTQTEKD